MIVVIGGSFDPIHNGHIDIARIVEREVAPSRIIFMPTYQNPLKDKNLASDDQRLAMINLILPLANTIPWTLETQEIEQRIKYTYLSLRLLKEKYDKEIAFVIGSDILTDLPRWHQIDNLASEFKLLVVEREGYRLDQDIVRRYSLQVLKGHPRQVSSSRDRGTMDPELFPGVVIDYIRRNHLFLEDRVKAMMSTERFEHTLSVVAAAVSYCRSAGVDEHQARLAALLHDIAKDLPPKRCREMLPPSINVNDVRLHQVVGAMIARVEFLVDDDDVLIAIAHHTTGDMVMSPLMKVVYAADKTCLGRDQELMAMQPLLADQFERGFSVLCRLLYGRYKDVDDPISVKMYMKYGNIK